MRFGYCERRKGPESVFQRYSSCATASRGTYSQPTTLCLAALAFHLMARERSRGCLDWFIYADLDWETVSQKPKEYSPGIAGAAFGAGWWCWYRAHAPANAVTKAVGTMHSKSQYIHLQGRCVRARFSCAPPACTHHIPYSRLGGDCGPHHHEPDFKDPAA